MSIDRTPNPSPASRPGLLKASLALAGMLALLSPAPPAAETAAPPPLEVFTGIPPCADLVERIGGPRVQVRVLLDKARDPHTFEASPQQMAALSKARLFFHTALPFEKMLAQRLAASRPALRRVDLMQGIDPIHGSCSEPGHDHAHHDHAGHEADVDPHVWLGPAELGIMARRITGVLCEEDPAHAPEFHARLANFESELQALDAALRQRLEPHRGREFLVFHPAFAYFARAYGLRQQAIETEGQSPSPRQLARIIETARAARARVLFVQPQFDRKAAEAVARAVGARVVEVDPLPRHVIAGLGALATALQESWDPAEPAP